MSENEAIKAAKITKGYAFGYQLLGYIMFNQKKTIVDEQVLREFDLALDEKSYSKIYSELTNKEKEIVHAIANGNNTNEKVMSILDMKSNALSVYKQTLNKKGILDVSIRGKLEFVLPRFGNFVLFQEKL